LVALAALLFSYLLIGLIWQASATASADRTFPPPGQLVDVGGYSLHLHCTGRGSPTVILEGGVPEWSIHWQAVQPGIAKFTRVCAYDRAGYGWSDVGPKPRTARHIVEELHSLLTNAGEQGPYVLVAHSLWGPAALLFQDAYPEEVAGLVLIESWSPDLFSPLPDVIEQSLPLNRAMGTLASLGQVRVFAELGILPIGDMLKADLLPEELRAVYSEAYYSPMFWTTMNDEYSAMEESAVELQDIGSLGDLPMRVIQAGTRPVDDYPPDAIWNEVQSRLAALSSSAQLTVADMSGHFVQLEQPDLVIDAVRQVWAETR
jgi:pimeloyl-ACP methyl ester carboxylesterase